MQFLLGFHSISEILFVLSSQILSCEIPYAIDSLICYVSSKVVASLLSSILLLFVESVKGGVVELSVLLGVVLLLSVLLGVELELSVLLGVVLLLSVVGVVGVFVASSSFYGESVEELSFDGLSAGLVFVSSFELFGGVDGDVLSSFVSVGFVTSVGEVGFTAGSSGFFTGVLSVGLSVVGFVTSPGVLSTSGFFVGRTEC